MQHLQYGGNGLGKQSVKASTVIGVHRQCIDYQLELKHLQIIVGRWLEREVTNVDNLRYRKFAVTVLTRVASMVELTDSKILLQAQNPHIDQTERGG
jgi:hypothetical protein